MPVFALALHEDHAGRIWTGTDYAGELYRLSGRDELLHEFDMYEACGENFPQPTEYIRAMLQVALDDGSASEAWTYVYNWPVTKLPRITSGKFLEQ